eukprot:7386223-Prymnesium_polylepis.4
MPANTTAVQSLLTLVRCSTPADELRTYWFEIIECARKIALVWCVACSPRLRPCIPFTHEMTPCCRPRACVAACPLFFRAARRGSSSSASSFASSPVSGWDSNRFSPLQLSPTEVSICIALLRTFCGQTECTALSGRTRARATICSRRWRSSPYFSRSSPVS